MRASHGVQTQDGYPSLDLTISAVTVNPARILGGEPQGTLALQAAARRAAVAAGGS